METEVVNRRAKFFCEEHKKAAQLRGRVEKIRQDLNDLTPKSMTSGA